MDGLLAVNWRQSCFCRCFCWTQSSSLRAVRFISDIFNVILFLFACRQIQYDPGFSIHNSIILLDIHECKLYICWNETVTVIQKFNVIHVYLSFLSLVLFTSIKRQLQPSSTLIYTHSCLYLDCGLILGSHEYQERCGYI